MRMQRNMCVIVLNRLLFVLFQSTSSARYDAFSPHTPPSGGNHGNAFVPQTPPSVGTINPPQTPPSGGIYITGIMKPEASVDEENVTPSSQAPATIAFGQVLEHPSPPSPHLDTFTQVC